MKNNLFYKKALLVFLLSGTASLASAQSDTIVDGIQYKADWGDEFNGTTLDPAKWFVMSSSTGYWDSSHDPSKANPYVQNGILYCPIRLVGGKWYQSGVITMNDISHQLLKSFVPNTYIEIRVKMPKGVLPTTGGNSTGIWSAGWLMPARLQPGGVDYYFDAGGGNYAYWPEGGEIDMWETQWDGGWDNHMIWSGPIQSVNSNPGNATQIKRYLSSKALGVSDFESDWHTFGFHWYKDASGNIRQRYRIDGNLILDCYGGNFTGGPVDGDKWAQNNLVGQWPKAAFQAGVHGTGPVGSPFEKPFYLILNSSVKGGGPIDQSNVNVNPANDGIALQIDWVHAYIPGVSNPCINNPVTAVSLNKASTSIQLCRTEQLIATVAPANACDQAMTWTSDNTAVATVDASGLVTAVATGTANITVKTNSGGFTKTCAVTVTEIQTAYNNVTRTIPGRTEAEDYDTGGECVAYHDTQPGNYFTGTPYRNEDVDIKVTGDSQGGGYDVGQGFNGEWLEYTLDATAGTYDIHARVGSANSGNQLVVKLDGTILGTINVPNMGNWNDKSTQTISGVNIPGGNKKILRLEIVGNGVDINWVEFINTTTGIVSNEISPGISVYPNPTSGIFTIEYSGEDKNIQLSVNDVLGRTVLSKQYGTNTIHHQLDLSGFPDGMYTIKLTTGNQIKTTKLIKQ